VASNAINGRQACVSTTSAASLCQGRVPYFATADALTAMQSALQLKRQELDLKHQAIQQLTKEISNLQDAIFAAQRCFNAATIAAFPALLSLRFGFDGSGVADSDSARRFAHLRCWGLPSSVFERRWRSFVVCVPALQAWQRFQRRHPAAWHGVRQSVGLFGPFEIRNPRWRQR